MLVAALLETTLISCIHLFGGVLYNSDAERYLSSREGIVRRVMHPFSSICAKTSPNPAESTAGGPCSKKN